MSAEKRAPMRRRSLSLPNPGTTDVVMDGAGELVGFCVYGRPGIKMPCRARAQVFYASLGFGPDGAEKQDLKLTDAPLRLLPYWRATGDRTISPGGRPCPAYLRPTR
jgi:hypothetical protein